MKAKLESTTVFQKNWEEYQKKKHRIVINEGGTGSSKTISLAQLFAMILVRENGIQLTIARKTLPALRATAMKDFLNVLRQLGIYREEWHNKSEFTYHYKDNEVDFISIDEPTRVRSRRRDYLWLNEANEFSLEDYRQLSMRTDKQIYLDYNPSHLFHWIYDELQTRKDCIVIPSTYRDNPFLSEDLIKEIESYKDKDQNYWRIYGLGLKAVTESLIYTHWQFCDSLPVEFEKVIYGLDFGYNNPTALVKVLIKDQNYYWEEKLYERHLTNKDLIGKLEKLVSKEDLIIADSEDPQSIQTLKDADFNIEPCFKTKIKTGVDAIKSHSFFITKNSLNLLKEVKSYQWKVKNGKPLEEPVKENDHLLDAGRYVIITEPTLTPMKIHFW
jgi:phage terminase large subunit